MEKINNKVRTMFFIALGLSVGFPLGVLGIVFGATKWIIFLLVVGIILVVAGFYVMPLMWVKYADLRHDRTLVFMIENEHLYTVQELARQMGHEEQDIRNRITKLIRNHVLTGYIFKDDCLELNANEKQIKKSAKTKSCSQCGARMSFDGVKFYCEYCGNIQKDE